jgi:hypothetical protein
MKDCPQNISFRDTKRQRLKRPDYQLLQVRKIWGFMDTGFVPSVFDKTYSSCFSFVVVVCRDRRGKEGWRKAEQSSVNIIILLGSYIIGGQSKQNYIER